MLQTDFSASHQRNWSCVIIITLLERREKSQCACLCVW